MQTVTLDHLTKRYGGRTAVNEISLTLGEGVYGLLGANGAGKTTLMRMLCGILEPDGGRILYGSSDIARLGEDYRAMLGYLPQDFGYYPDFTALEFLRYMACLKGLTRTEADHRIPALLGQVGLAEVGKKKIRAYSGGMKQRVVIALALACNPKLLIADEPTTALDVTIQAQVLELMRKIRDEYDMSMIMITHDLGIVAEICDSVAVMYAGRIVERGTLADVFLRTKHPYTEGLFNSLPDISNRKAALKPIPGMMPDPSNLPKGCAFAPRCQYATEKCYKTRPDVTRFSDTHSVMCLAYEDSEFHLKD